MKMSNFAPKIKKGDENALLQGKQINILAK